MKVTHIRRVTPEAFCSWIIRGAGSPPNTYIPDGKVKIMLHRARIEGDQKVVIDGDFYAPALDGSEIGDYIVRDCISFDLIRLDAERTEIEANCSDVPGIRTYFHELLGEIEKRWKAENPNVTNIHGGVDIQGNVDVGNDLVAGDKNIGRDQISASRDIHYYNYEIHAPNKNARGAALAKELLALLSPLAKSFEKIRPGMSGPAEIRQVVERLGEIDEKANALDPYFELSEINNSLYLIQKTMIGFFFDNEQYVRAESIFREDKVAGIDDREHAKEFARLVEKVKGKRRLDGIDNIYKEIEKIKTILRPYINANE